MKKILLCIIFLSFCFADEKNGWSTLHQAVYDNNLVAIEKSIDEDSTLIEQKSNAGITPLHIAVKLRRMDIVKILLAKGADVDAQDNNGLTPLHYAIGQNQEELSRYLITIGADMDIQNSEGITPLHQAAFRGNVALIQFMLDNNANIDILNNQGATACQLAFAKKNIGVYELLRVYTKLECGDKK
ncbi:MAG: ankyrin repeat domain-containing protein [Campylobacterales bacterium]|nr:ankyrin repeat domain-containing protein [Campylobacterales bacterium]